MSRGFLGGKQVINFSNTKNRGRVCLFLLTTESEQLFFIKDDKGNSWVEVIIFTCLNAVAIVDVLTARNNDVHFVETQTLHLHDIQSSFRFKRINKIYRDYSRWQILSFVCPPEKVTLLLSHQS